MNNTVCKYSIMSGIANMPKGAEIVHVNVIKGELFVWALVDICKPVIQRNFAQIPTDCTDGNMDNMKYLFTFINEDEFAWHIFEVLE